MSAQELTLPGLEIVRDARSLYGDPSMVHIDCLDRFPEAVVHGMRRELVRLERAGVPAYADGRRIWTPNGSYFIDMNGQPSRYLTSVADFDSRARHAAKRMEEHNGYSFTRTFAKRYLKENTNNA